VGAGTAGDGTAGDGTDRRTRTAADRRGPADGVRVPGRKGESMGHEQLGIDDTTDPTAAKAPV
jgi:hypothetical protein